MKLLVTFLLFTLLTFASAAPTSQDEAENNASLAARETLRNR